MSAGARIEMRQSPFAEEFSNLKQDFTANSSLLVRIMLANYRFGHAIHRAGISGWRKRISSFAYRVVFNLIAIPLGGGEIHAACEIGPGVKFVHRLNGTIIHPRVRIGSNLTIYHQVTIGRSKYRDGQPLVPKIGNEVTIYPGTKIIGEISIGEGAIIGANAVVATDVPSLAKALAPKALIRW